MKKIRIGGRWIGQGCLPFVIAEAGINHNGKLKMALEMVTAARKAGADAVKFQTFKASEFVGDPRQTFTYRSQGRTITESMLKMFRRYELSETAWGVIKKRCEQEGILFLSTPQNRSDLDVLMNVGVPAIKVGSDDFTNLPLLRDYAMTKLPMIVSCGMAELREVRQSLGVIGALRGYPAVLLLCTSQYPTPARDVNLAKLNTLRREFPELPLGFSDHTQGCLAAPMAAALGACVFEKHFTLDHGLPGPDHWFSEDPHGLEKWVASIRQAHLMVGSSVIKPTACEKKMKILARRSIIALSDIRKGDILDAKKIGLRRPGGGLPPSEWDRVMGLTATRAISKGKLLRVGDFNP